MAAGVQCRPASCACPISPRCWSRVEHVRIDQAGSGHSPEDFGQGTMAAPAGVIGAVATQDRHGAKFTGKP